MIEFTKHVAIISNPIVRDGAMLLSVFIPDWSKDLCFYYPLNQVDNKMLHLHLMWKFSGDLQVEVRTLVDLFIRAKSKEELKLHNWRFHEDI